LKTWHIGWASAEPPGTEIDMPGTDTDAEPAPADTDTPGSETDTPGMDPEIAAVLPDPEEITVLPDPAIATPRPVPEVTIVPLPLLLEAATAPGPLMMMPWPDPEVATAPLPLLLVEMAIAGHGTGSLPGSPAACARVGPRLVSEPGRPAALRASIALTPAIIAPRRHENISIVDSFLL
jgi:hypothetical protein